MISKGMSRTWRALARGAAVATMLAAGAAAAQGVFPAPAAAPDVAVRITGTVEVIVPYGTGYVVGGSFDLVNGESRRNLALLDANGELADGGLEWAEQGTDGTVRALAVSGDDLFIGGEFGNVAGTPRSFIAKLSLAGSGAVDPDFAPQLDGQVRALATDGSTVYAGGVFSSANGSARDDLAAFDAASGVLDTGFVPGYQDSEAVNALALDGTHLYVGGKLKATNPGALGHNRAIARLSAASGGLDTGWLARIHPRGGAEVWSIAVGADSVYLGGQFRSVGQGGGNTRDNLAELLKSNASRTSWNPGANGPVRAISLVTDGLGGESLLVAGEFTSVGGSAHDFLAHIGADGNATAFSADADRPVRAVLASGNQALAGGAFRTLGGDNEDGLARLDVATGARDTSFAAEVAGPGAVHAFVFDEAGGIVFGGEFDSVDVGGVSHARANLARLDASLALDLAWSLDVAGAVHAIAVDSINHRLYLGGAFLQVADGAGGTAARQRLAAYDSSAGLALLPAWVAAADGTVTGLVLDAAGRLYVHGQFPTSPRPFAARLDSSGAVDAFNASVDGPVHALAVEGATVLLGGAFSSAGGADHDNLARVHADDDGLGVLAGQDAGLVANADGSVQTLLVDATGTYVGGSFAALQGQARSGAARLDASGAVDGWNPDVDGSVDAITNAGGWIVMGGSFGSAGGAVHPNLARASAADAAGTVDPAWRPGTSDPVAQLAALGLDGSVLLAGAFDQVTGVARGGLAVLGPQGSDLSAVTIGTIIPEPSVVGQAWSVPFSVENTTQGTPASGTVTVTTDAGESCGPVVLVAGAGACEITSASAGTRQVTVSYASGLPEVMDSSASTGHVVDVAATSLEVLTGPNPSQTNTDATATISLSVAAPGAGTPSGTVAISSVDALAVPGPSCSIDLDLAETGCVLNFTASGTYTVSAAYAGDGNFAAAADDTLHVVMDEVVAMPTTTAISPLSATVVGEAYTVSVQVSAVLEPVGTVAVDDGTTSCEITLQPGDAGAGSCQLASTSAGAKTITASYAGNASFEPSSDSVSHEVAKAATELGLLVQSAVITAGDDAVFTWTLDVVPPGAGNPTGTVTVSSGATQCSAPVGAGGCSIPAMVEGNYDFGASYSGDADFLADASDGTVPVTVGAGGALIADVAVRHEIVASGILFDGSGDLVDYEFEVANTGNADANGVLLDMLFPEQFVPADTSWTCTGSGGGVCGSPSGTADIGFTVDLPAGGSVLVEISTRIVDPEDAGVETAATATFAGAELDESNNSATTFYRSCSASVLLVVGEFTSLPPHVCGFRDGFEDRGID